MDEGVETIEIPETLYLEILKKVTLESHSYNSVTDFVKKSLEYVLIG